MTQGPENLGKPVQHTQHEGGQGAARHIGVPVANTEGVRPVIGVGGSEPVQRRVPEGTRVMLPVTYGRRTVALGMHKDEVHEPIENPLSDRERTVLQMRAAGVKRDRIKELLHIGEATLETLLTETGNKLDTRSAFEATVTAVRRRYIQPPPLSSDIADKIKSLSPAERRVVQKLLADNGQVNEAQEVADALEVRKRTVDKSLGRIIKKFRARSTLQVVVEIVTAEMDAQARGVESPLSIAAVSAEPVAAPVKAPARQREVHQTRQVTFAEVDNALQKAQVDAAEEGPAASVYEQYERLAEQMRYVPETAQVTALQAISEGDPRGTTAITLLNIASILDGVARFEDYYRGDRDDIVQEAMTQVYAEASSLHGDPSRVTEQINEISRRVVVDFIAERDGVPAAWVSENRDHSLIAEIDTAIDSGSLAEERRISEEKVRNLAGTLDADPADVTDIVTFRSVYGDTGQQRVGPFPPEQVSDPQIVEELMDLQRARDILHHAEGGRLEVVVNNLISDEPVAPKDLMGKIGYTDPRGVGVALKRALSRLRNSMSIQEE